MLKKNIPTIIFVGMFFFSAFCRANSLALATDLFERGEWDLCHRECIRAILAQTEPAGRFQLLDAMALARGGKDPAATMPLFESIIADRKDAQISAIASYELGRLQWQTGSLESALESFAFAFQSTIEKDLFLHAGCSMFLLFDKHPELKKGREDLLDQITTSRDQWYGALFAQCAKPDPSKDKPEAPGWFIRFYRSQISPAIGSRCNLEPSCSEYFQQAKAKHGIWAFPMMADRFYREPDVNIEKKDPIVMPSGLIRYRDPVENHDFWMKK